MAQVLTDESNYEDIADAIREKNGTSDTYTPSEMARAIRGIETGGDVTGVKGNAESSYRTGNVNITPANIGAKAVQSAVSSPSASGTAIEFIDSISQDAQGVITPAKKTVRVATTSQSGLMSATDKEDLNADTIAKNLIVKLRDELSYPIAEGSVVIRYISSSYRLYRAKTTISSDADDVEASWEYLSSNVYKSGYLSKIVYGIKTVHNAVATDVDNLVYPLQPYTIYHDEYGNMYQLGSSGADDASSAWWTIVPNLGYCVSENRRRIESVSNSASTARSMAQGLQASFAPFYYSGLFPIAAGQMVLYGSTNDKRLYRALVDIQEAEDFTAAHWEQVTVDELITALQAALAASEAKRMAMYPTGTISGPVAAFPDGAEDVPVKALTVNIASQTGVTGLTLTHTGKNLLPLTVEGIKAANTSGTWDGNAYTVTGVTHTILTDTDGTVTGIRISGSPTGSRTLFKLSDHMAEFATILSGCPAGGSAHSYALQFNGTKRDFGSGASIAGDGTTGSVYIIVRPGYTASDLLFAPMIRPASIEDSAFEPYKPVLYEIDFPQEAGSVTSGTLDIINGVLTTSGQDYDVTPVDVRTLLGANAIYADHGDVSVTYRADPTLQHDNLDGGDVRYIPYLGVYGNNTVGKALRDMEDTIVNMNNDIGSLQGAILGDKLLVFNQDGTVSWEEAPV